MVEFWRTLSIPQRLSLLVGVLLIGAGSAWLYWSLSQQDYQPLYTDLHDNEVQQVTQKLAELKIDYRLSADGQSVLVPADLLNEDRVRLAGAGLSLRGNSGFELFDKADYGMTEFAQKINYQRALQGELERTIMSFGEIRYARVHLVLPEASLFKRKSSEPKASVTLLTKPGRTLTEAQIVGIQNLVAASVDGMQPQQVTVLDHRGEVLSHASSENESMAPGRLAQKQAIEQYYEKKAAEVLAQVFGTAPASVHVDVALNYDRVEKHREELLPIAGTGKGALSNQSQERHTGAADANTHGSPVNETNKTEYLYGREVETVVNATGSISRITVSVVVPKGTSPEQLAQVRGLIGSAVGIDASRGDTVELAPIAMNKAPEVAPEQAASIEPQLPVLRASSVDSASNRLPAYAPQLFVGVAVGLSFLMLIWVVSRNSTSRRRLSAEERTLMLEDIKSWIRTVD